MGLLKNPNELSGTILLAGMIYGQPGTGKTSLALSAPNPVMIDSDNGMHRVQKRFQAPSLPLGDYQDLRTLVESNELDPFDTIIIDTTGRLIDRIGDYIAAEDPKARRRDGALSLPGYGQLRTEFRWLMRTVKDHKKHLIFVAHDQENRNDDGYKVRPDLGPGGSGKELINDLDFIGYMEMIGNDRTISFNPCEKFYAKNSFNLPPVIRIPDINQVPNDFISGYLMGKAREKKAADDAQNAEYVKLVADNKAMIEAVTDAKSANEVVKEMVEAPVIWDSLRQARHAFGERVKELGLEYDRAAKEYVKAKVEVEKTRDEQTADPTAGERPIVNQQTGSADSRPAGVTSATRSRGRSAIGEVDALDAMRSGEAAE